MTTITLTEDQENAIKQFTGFMANDAEKVFVISGYSGTGKSTLISHLMDRLPNIIKTLKLVNPSFREYALHLTATTNKAAENFSNITGHEVKTIQSHLGLVVQTDYKTREQRLVPRRFQQQTQQLLFIDEASYVDHELMGWITKTVDASKIVFIGDPAQLIQFKAKNALVFSMGYPEAKLEKVVRQAEHNPIVELSTKFRNTVNTGEFFSFTPDKNHIQYLNRDDFNKSIEKEFIRPDWQSKDSKVLAWTNKCVVEYNKMIGGFCNGRSHFEEGDYAVCNQYFHSEKGGIKTDAAVLITSKSAGTVKNGVPGHFYTLDGYITAFCPDNHEDKKALEKKAKAAGDIALMDEIDSKWIDLRAMYACTINKSQGSTYERVFIDLDDIKKCNSGNQIARMLYVAVSRAKHQVFFTGDLV